MNLKTRFLALSLALSLLGLGCNPNPPNPPEPPAAPGPAAAPNPPPVAATNGCVHPYLPLKQGYKAVYKSNIQNNSGYTMEVTSVAQNLANLKYSADGGVFVNHTIRCENGVLNEDSYLDMSRFFMANAQNVSVTAQRLEGSLLPNDLTAGTEWTARFRGAAAERTSGMSSEVEVSATKRAVGTEPVTTPAGTFATAMKVTATYTIKTKVLSPALMDLPPMTFTGTEWWAPGKGLVKSASTFGSTNVTTEAQSIVAP